MRLGKHRVRLGIGIFIGIFFMFLAVHKVDFSQMSQAFEVVNYWYLLPTLPILFFSHFLRALRWRFLIDPIKRVDTQSLFSSLIIGYMANLLMPAHVGEVLRAYVLSKKRSIAGVLGLFVFFVLLRKLRLQMQKLLVFFLRRFPRRFQHKIAGVVESFVSGVVPLKRRSDYPAVSVLSVLIWTSYGLVFYFSLHAFNFISTYHLPWSASLVLLVVTTIAIVIPSSPGYVEAYHYLCQISLALFGVPVGPALSFAAVVHGINFLPVLLIGLIFAYYEGVAIFKVPETVATVEG